MTVTLKHLGPYNMKANRCAAKSWEGCDGVFQVIDSTHRFSPFSIPLCSVCQAALSDQFFAAREPEPVSKPEPEPETTEEESEPYKLFG